MGDHVDLEVEIGGFTRLRRAEVLAEEPRRVDARFVTEGQHDPLRVGIEFVEGLRPLVELEGHVDVRTELLDHGVDDLLIVGEFREFVRIEEVDQVEVVVAGRRGDIGPVGLDVRDLDVDGHVRSLDGRRVDLLEGAPVGDVAVLVDDHGIGVVVGILRQILVFIFVAAPDAHRLDELPDRHVVRRGRVGGQLREVLQHGALVAAQLLEVDRLHQIGAEERLGIGGFGGDRQARVGGIRGREGEGHLGFGRQLRAEFAAGDRSVGCARFIHPVGVEDVFRIGIEPFDFALLLAAQQALGEGFGEGDALVGGQLFDQGPVVGLERLVVDVGRLADVVGEVGQGVVVGRNREGDRGGRGFVHLECEGQLLPRGGVVLLRFAGEEGGQHQNGAQQRKKSLHGKIFKGLWVGFLFLRVPSVCF